jgi:hypothetical protein
VAESHRAVVGEVSAQVEAVEQGGTEKRTSTHRENRDFHLAPAPDNGGGVNVYPDATAIGQSGRHILNERKAEGYNGTRRQRERAREACIDNKLHRQIGRVGQAKDHPNPRLQPKDGPPDHGAVRSSEPPTAKTAL